MRPFHRLRCEAIFSKGKLTGFEIFDSVASCLVYSPSQKHDEQVMELVAGQQL